MIDEIETRARRGDPETSRQAAAGQTEAKLTATQRRVLNCFRVYGNMTDTTLVKMLNNLELSAGIKTSSPSGARSRRKDLSRGNEERLRELRHMWYYDHGNLAPHHEHGTGVLTPEEERAIERVHRDAAAEWARRTLRIEGFRAPLWDTGGREKLATGYESVVWGLAT